MAAPNRDFLFVYGTLRRNCRTEMSQLLAANAGFVSPGWFNGKLFLVGDYPGAIPSADPSDRVHGEIFELFDAELILPRLDDYEECGMNNPRPTEYVREKRKISLEPGGIVEAWIYLYNRPIAGLAEIASGDFTLSGTVGRQRAEADFTEPVNLGGSDPSEYRPR